MKQFTEADMIEFPEWLGQNSHPHPYNSGYFFYYLSGTAFTTSELLEIFLNKDNKPNEES